MWIMKTLCEDSIARGRPGVNRAGNSRLRPNGFGRFAPRVALAALVVSTGLAATAAADSSQEPPTKEAQIAAIKSVMEKTVHRIQEIAGQPVTRLARTPDMDVTLFPGWFHPGAMRPNFNSVDVRATQEFPYDKFGYVASDQNPNVVFIGHELEFNSMIKLFYADRSCPKRKLSEPAMLEINHLYRILGRSEQQLAELQKDEPQQALLTLLVSNRIYVAGAALFLLAFGLYLLQRRRTQVEASY